MTEEPKDPDDELSERYRQASRAEGASASAAAREAILTEGRRIAALRSQTPASHGIDTNQPAANQPRWRLAAVASLGVAAIAALLILPRVWEPPHRVAATDAAPRPEAASPDRPPMLAEPAAADYSEARAASEAPTAKAQSDAAPSAPPAAPASSSADSAAPAVAIGGAVARANSSSFGAPLSLLSAVSSGDADQVARLLDQGADVRQSDSSGRTPLLLAVMARRADLVRLLLAHGADPNAPDHTGDTPLNFARRSHASELASQLEAAGAR